MFKLLSTQLKHAGWVVGTLRGREKEKEKERGGGGWQREEGEVHCDIEKLLTLYLYE